tara:strand:- start:218 stop:676 length:459 start_codon:yes stop_codon:yes gene_type:complete
MLSLLGSLLGFGTSFLPQVMGYFQDKQDKSHELMMLAATTEAQVKVEGVRLQGVKIDASIREIEALQKQQSSAIRKGSRWLANLSGSIRPVVTYLFVLEFLIINTSISVLLLNQEGVTIETLQLLLDEEFMALLSTMLSFWFGNRMFGKRKS